MTAVRWIVLIGSIVGLLLAGGLVWSLSTSQADQQSDVRQFGEPPTVTWPTMIYCTTDQDGLRCEEADSSPDRSSSFELVATYNYAQVGQPFHISALTTEPHKDAIVCELPGGQSLQCAEPTDNRTFTGEVAMYWGQT